MHDRTVQRVEFLPDKLASGDGTVMTVADHVGLQAAHSIYRASDHHRLPVAITANGDQVGEMAERTAEQVAGEADPVLGQPHDERIVGLRPGHRDHLEGHAAEFEHEFVLDQQVRRRFVLRGKVRVVLLRVVVESLGKLAREGKAGTTGAKRRQTRVVGLVLGIVRRGDHTQAGIALAKPGRTADVVHVALGKDQRVHRLVGELAEVRVDHRRLHAHAGIELHAALVRLDQVGIGERL